MPPTTRRRQPPQLQEPQLSDDDASENGELEAEDVLIDDEEEAGELMQGVEGEEGGEGDEEDGNLDATTILPANPPLPPHSREISSLASWTVSSSKPGCGIAALRDPSPNHFWQSDGPQPHYLNIHFFKIVSIVGIRLYLDFEADESYTPTKIQFLAGMGRNDLVSFSVMELERPRGWMEVDMSGVGCEESDLDSSYESQYEDDENVQRRSKVPVLRAMLVQVRILENHQNGKDTHLRGLQIYARDKTTGQEVRKVQGTVQTDAQLAIRKKQKKRLMEPEWTMVPELR